MPNPRRRTHEETHRSAHGTRRACLRGHAHRPSGPSAVPRRRTRFIEGREQRRPAHVRGHHLQPLERTAADASPRGGPQAGRQPLQEGANPPARACSRSPRTGIRLRQSPPWRPILAWESIVQGPGAVLPGTSLTFTVEASKKARRLSWISMLICTNDGFTGVRNLRLPAQVGGEKFRYVRGYDAGTEINTESFSDLVPTLPRADRRGDGRDGDRRQQPGVGRERAHPASPGHQGRRRPASVSARLVGRGGQDRHPPHLVGRLHRVESGQPRRVFAPGFHPFRPFL